MYQETYGYLRQMLLEELQRARPVDGIVLALHGAMCAESVDDTEGDLLAAVRELAGPDIPIAMTLDLHANVTSAMASHVQALIGYKTWPHIDHYETGENGAKLLLRTLAGEIRPVTVMCKIPMILPAENMHTARGPMAEVFAVGEQFGRKYPAVISSSVFGVQPWMDVSEMGCATVCVVDADRAVGERCV